MLSNQFFFKKSAGFIRFLAIHTTKKADLWKTIDPPRIIDRLRQANSNTSTTPQMMSSVLPMA